MNSQTKIKSTMERLITIPLIISVGVGNLMITSGPTLAQPKVPQRWESKTYKAPTNLGTTARREPAGTRGGCLNPNPDKKLTALVPINSYGVTTSAYPTLFFYVPSVQANQSATLNFSLVDDTGDTVEEISVYKSTILTNSKGGIVAITLPKDGGIKPLEMNKDYLWKMSLACGTESDAGQNFVQGRIRRIALKPSLKNKLNQVKAIEKVGVYAESEIWFDALATLAEVRRNNPGDANAYNSWKQLLQAVKLDVIAKESLSKNDE